MFVLQVAVLTGLAGLPWVVKPVYGFISDSIPLFGYRSVYAAHAQLAATRQAMLAGAHYFSAACTPGLAYTGTTYRG
jgi:hypothetical protein